MGTRKTGTIMPKFSTMGKPNSTGSLTLKRVGTRPRRPRLRYCLDLAQKHMASTRPMVQQAPDMVTKLERVW